MKKKYYYIIWIEGFEYFNGEKILSLDKHNHNYTLKMTKALRIRPEHKEQVRELLREQGIADWCIDSENTFVRTNYAPKGTIYSPCL